MTIERNPEAAPSLAEVLAFLTPETWTPEQRQALEDGVFVPIDGRRQAAGTEKLSMEDRDRLLTDVRHALARAIDMYSDEIARNADVLRRKSDTKARRNRLEVAAKHLERAAREIEGLPFDDQDRLSRLTFDFQTRSDLANIVPAVPTHLFVQGREVPVQALQLRAMSGAAHQLLDDLHARPSAAPWRRIRRELIRELIAIFARFSGTRPTRVVDADGSITGRLERFVRALLPHALHDPAVGLDHEIRGITKEILGTISTRSS
jgi:hypothetical protein